MSLVQARQSWPWKGFHMQGIARLGPTLVAACLPCGCVTHTATGNIYNGSNLVDYSASQDLPAIVVTVNYRLNIFGASTSRHREENLRHSKPRISR